jgi:hypothetical protein
VLDDRGHRDPLAAALAVAAADQEAEAAGRQRVGLAARLVAADAVRGAQDDVGAHEATAAAEREPVRAAELHAGHVRPVALGLGPTYDRRGRCGGCQPEQEGQDEEAGGAHTGHRLPGI